VIDGYETGRLKPYKKFVCGGEESFGFMAGSFVRDKDGVISCCLAAEMTAYYRSKGKTLVDVLNDMYTRHGVYYETLHTLTLPGKEGAEKIKDMMNRMRNQPPAKIDGIAVKSLQDYELSKTFIKIFLIDNLIIILKNPFLCLILFFLVWEMLQVPVYLY
jgi:phosphoglucomutase